MNVTTPNIFEQHKTTLFRGGNRRTIGVYVAKTCENKTCENNTTATFQLFFPKFVGFFLFVVCCDRPNWVIVQLLVTKFTFSLASLSKLPLGSELLANISDPKYR